MILMRAADVIVLGSAVYHAVMGVACLMSRRHISYMMKLVYGMEFPEIWDPLAEYSVKPLGAFAIFTSVTCAATYVQPNGVQVWIQLGLAFLFAARAAFRYLYRSLFASAMKIAWSNSRWNVLLNLVLTAILIAAALCRLLGRAI